MRGAIPFPLDLRGLITLRRDVTGRGATSRTVMLHSGPLRAGVAGSFRMLQLKNRVEAANDAASRGLAPVPRCCATISTSNHRLLACPTIRVAAIAWRGLRTLSGLGFVSQP
jgi:hypothetical protein